VIEFPFATTPPVGKRPLFSLRQLILGLGNPVALQVKVKVSPAPTVNPLELLSDIRGGIRTDINVSAVTRLVALVTT